MNNPTLFPLFDKGAVHPDRKVTLDEVRQRDRDVPLIIADGMGVDSTAMLLALKARAIRPDLILFADTGGEKPETYRYIELRCVWLAASGFPAFGNRSLYAEESARPDAGRPVPANEDLAESGLRRQELLPVVEGCTAESILLPLGTRALVLASRKETDQGDRI